MAYDEDQVQQGYFFIFQQVSNKVETFPMNVEKIRAIMVSSGKALRRWRKTRQRFFFALNLKGGDSM